MIELLEQLDVDLFIFLNGLHNGFADAIMLFFTNRYYPFPLYAALIALIIWKYRMKGFWALLFISLSVLAANHLTSEMMKPYFGRLRPCYNEDLVDVIHLLVPCGGEWSFASSHASSSFGLATSLWLLFRQKFRWTWIAFVWASLVSYSRIHVGKHYPADVLAGALVGIMCAWLLYQFYVWLDRKYSIKN